MSYWKTNGETAGQYIRALGIAKGVKSGAIAYAESQRWSAREEIQQTFSLMRTKAAIPAIGVQDGLANTPVGADFFEALRPLSLIGQLTKVGKRPLMTRMLSPTGAAGAAGAAVGEGLALPMSTSGYTSFFLKPQKVTGLIAVTNELLRVAEPETDQSLTNDLAAAVGQAEDVAFISPAVAGSVLNGMPTVASTGGSVAQIDADLEATVNALSTSGSNLSAATWLLSPKTATHLALMRSSGGSPAYPQVSAIGGVLAGLPVVTSGAISDFIGLIDQTSIVIGEDKDVEIAYSGEAALQMLSNPTESSLTPTSATMTSMFQADTTAIRAVLYRAWYGRPGAGVTLTGVSY